jgi:hypothetical protein
MSVAISGVFLINPRISLRSCGLLATGYGVRMKANQIIGGLFILAGVVCVLLRGHDRQVRLEACPWRNSSNGFTLSDQLSQIGLGP